VIDFINLREDVVTLPLEKKSLAYVTEENKLHVFWEDILIPRLRKLTVCGVDRIRDLVIVASKPFEEWEITTSGSNFKGILEMGKFDFRMLKTNNMWEIYHVLGIEATREFLVREFTSVISSDGTYINPCHVLLLVDTMTRNGDITSISRYSLRSKPSVLSRTSFEESIENFLRAGMFGEIDDIVSISSNIMTGKLSRIGTGICDILMTSDVFQEVDCVNNTVVKPPYNIELADQTQPAYDIVDLLPKMFDRQN
jgi:DNA-directed RNA polymerase beta' subunit